MDWPYCEDDLEVGGGGASKLLDPTSLKAPAGFKIFNLLVEDKTCSFNLNHLVSELAPQECPYIEEVYEYCSLAEKQAAICDPLV